MTSGMFFFSLSIFVSIAATPAPNTQNPIAAAVFGSTKSRPAGPNVIPAISRGLEEVELKELIHDTKEPRVRNMLQCLLNLHHGEDMLLTATKEGENYTRYSRVVKGEKMKSGKFDVLVVRATQGKQVDKKKLMTIGLASTSVGCIIGAVVNPVAGMITGSTMLGAAGLKTVFDFQKSPPDLIYGYILKNLNDKNLLNISNTDASNPK